MPPEDVKFMLGQMDAKLSMLLARTEEDRAADARRDERIASLEAFKWKVLGAASVLGSIAGFVTKILTS